MSIGSGENCLLICELNRTEKVRKKIVVAKHKTNNAKFIHGKKKTG